MRTSFRHLARPVHFALKINMPTEREHEFFGFCTWTFAELVEILCFICMFSFFGRSLDLSVCSISVVTWWFIYFSRTFWNALASQKSSCVVFESSMFSRRTDCPEIFYCFPAYFKTIQVLPFSNRPGSSSRLATLC